MKFKNILLLGLSSARAWSSKKKEITVLINHILYRLEKKIKLKTNY
jgi:hypothetical protein